MNKISRLPLCLLAFFISIDLLAQDEYPVSYVIDDNLKAEKGTSFTIKTKFNVSDPWYIYAPTGNNAAQGMVETNIIFNPPKGIVRKGKASLPKTDFKGGFEVYAGANVEFSQLFEVDKNLPAGEYIVKAKISYQTCNEKICLPPKTDELNIKIFVGNEDASGYESKPSEPVKSGASAKDSETEHAVSDTESINLSFTAMDGRKIDLNALKSKAVIVACWATWCKPCIQEFEHLKKLYKQYHEAGLEIIGVNMDEAPQENKVRELIYTHQVTWPQYFEGKGFDNNPLTKKHNIKSLPTVFFINKEGRIMDRDARGQKLEKLLSEHLTAPAPNTTFTTLNDEGIIFENSPFEKVLEKAKTENKYIFIDAYTTWCGPCKRMEKEVYPRPEVGEFFNKNFINAKFDMEKGEGISIAKKYHVTSFPNYLFIDYNRNIVHRFVGSMNAEAFIAKAADALDSSKQYGTLLRRFNNGDNAPDFLYNLAYMAKSAGEDSVAQGVQKKYLSTQKDLLDDKNTKIIFDFCNSVSHPSYSYMKKHEPKFTSSVGREKYHKKIEMLVYDSALKKAQYFSELKPTEFQKHVQIAKRFFEKELPGSAERLTHDFIIRGYIALQDVNGYANEMISWSEKHPSADWNELNSLAWNFYESVSEPAHLQKALAWALKSVKLNSVYANNDTVASLYYKLGEKEKAKLFALTAMELGKSEGADTSATQQLLEKINAL